jgi:aspartyl-tRNA(Asn)/glutamyl-tRNA(Gln) amidotransferase subunit C
VPEANRKADMDISLIRELAALARLDLPASREQEVAQKLGQVLAAFASLRRADTRDLAPEPAALPAPLRADEPLPPLPPAAVLANAPKAVAGCFLVPRVVEG